MLRSHEGKQWQNDCDFVQTHSSPFQWLLRWWLPDLWPLTVSHKVKSALSLQLNGVQLEITRSLFLIIVNVMNLLLFIADLCHLQTQKFTLNRNSYMDRTSQIWNTNSDISLCDVCNCLAIKSVGCSYLQSACDSKNIRCDHRTATDFPRHKEDVILFLLWCDWALTCFPYEPKRQRHVLFIACLWGQKQFVPSLNSPFKD